MVISIGADHAGFKVKEMVKKILLEKGIEVIDHGTFTPDSVDYPDYIRPAALDVAKGIAEKGIGVCGSGIGAAITANKVKGIRAAQVLDVEMARLSVEHNNANFIALAERLTNENEIKKIVETWLNSKFEGGRHQRRVDKIE
ncbi:MAG: ribose 5-phosphate isomerase B [Ignavibacteriales bacterium]|nr:MAG: ribose 5-phosphate isomerase B [Ignavibacteriales bacterium]